jgi:hypothetical protein
MLCWSVVVEKGAQPQKFVAAAVSYLIGQRQHAEKEISQTARNHTKVLEMGCHKQKELFAAHDLAEPFVGWLR